MIADASDLQADASACLLCKCILKRPDELACHLSSASHSGKVKAAMSNGSLTVQETGLRSTLRKLVAACYRKAHSCTSLVVQAVVQSPWINDWILWLSAPCWPKNEQAAPPRCVSDTLDGTPWGMAARGVELRTCEEPGKGKGIFAIRELKYKEVIGVYLGESLSQQAYALRHHTASPQLALHLWRDFPGGRHPSDAYSPERLPEDATHPKIVRALAAASEDRADRTARLAKLTEGAPIGGAINRGKYVFTLLPETAHYPETRTAYLDAEDPSRSSWCRYINNAPSAAVQCNLIAHVDGLNSLIWFEAKRDIRRGEELHFCYAGEPSEWQRTWSSWRSKLLGS